MDPAFRRRTLEEAGLVHPRADDVATPLFTGPLSFFLPDDKVQVKYEMLRAHILDGVTVGRQRVNCTAPTKSGRYQWFSHPWIIQ